MCGRGQRAGGLRLVRTRSGGRRGDGAAARRHFRLAVTGGGSGDIMDAQAIITKPDQARLMTAFETLLEYDESFVVRDTGLAERVTQDSPRQWTIELRRGIEFQNGKTLEAQDVVYSLRRIIDPKQGLPGAAGLSALTAGGIKAMDAHTVRLSLTRPSSIIADQLAQFYNAIVPVGYSRWPAPATRHGRLRPEALRARTAERT